MTAFKFPDDNQRLDWLILRDGPIVLYFDQAKLDEACAWFRNHSYSIASFDCTSWKSNEDFHEDIRQVLNFPDYYGCNLDALNDCMKSDLAIPQESGLLLVFHHFDTLQRLFPKTTYSLLDIIAEASRQYLLYGERLISFVQSDTRDIKFEPIGAQSVTTAYWEPRYED